MNYSALNSKATALIASLGLPITVTRNGLQLGKGHGVFTPSESNKEEGSTSPTILDLASKTLYLSSNQKFTPQVGDLVVAKTGQWQVINVEEYKPSTITVAFRLEVQ